MSASTAPATTPATVSPIARARADPQQPRWRSMERSTLPAAGRA
eukprot:CAMPEP_0202799096 /NCGR_PEP_ID=MMETSP1388-20130828/97621_1 /ASSEMBLY_ACC=CAM_ASM_000864 /TAXON_ID=37098 /ORGANISM="Isochrysis sp, Strain CCMP1244" /LENGTH=43 /DNA_ID= /DNA_START= /DNA_END= /DNA_ORIENTATION=